MPVFDQLQRASFDGLEFPVRGVGIKGSYRHHDHEYLRTPGAVIEKLERGLYMVEMDAVFDVNVRGYGDLWPAGLAAMRSKFEQGITSALTIPTIGTIRAFMPEWDQSADMGKVRSGERCRLVFKEDQSQLFLSDAAAKVQQSSVAASGEKLAVTLEDFELPEEEQSVFDEIQDISNSILAIKDQGDLYGGLLAAKVEQLAGLIRAADETLESLKDPVNHELLEALHELWEATVTLGQNLAESPRGPRTYTTPRQMTVGDVAAETQKLGGTDDAARIMLNNSLPDPFAIPAGTRIVYFTG